MRATTTALTALLYVRSDPSLSRKATAGRSYAPTASGSKSDAGLSSRSDSMHVLRGTDQQQHVSGRAKWRDQCENFSWHASSTENHDWRRCIFFVRHRAHPCLRSPPRRPNIALDPTRLGREHAHISSSTAHNLHLEAHHLADSPMAITALSGQPLRRADHASAEISSMNVPGAFLLGSQHRNASCCIARCRPGCAAGCVRARAREARAGP